MALRSFAKSVGKWCLCFGMHIHVSTCRCMYIMSLLDPSVVSFPFLSMPMHVWSHSHSSVCQCMCGLIPIPQYANPCVVSFPFLNMPIHVWSHSHSSVCQSTGNTWCTSFRWYILTTSTAVTVGKIVLRYT